MNKAPRYLLTDQFDLGMLSSLTADITLTEISLADVCQGCARQGATTRNGPR